MRLRLPSSLALLALVALPTAWAQDALSNALASLPACAISCLASAVSNSPCSFTNQTCLCTNADLQDDVTKCVTSGCTIREALFTKNVTQTNCNAPIRDKSKLLTDVATSLGTITGVMVAGRLGFKLFVAKTGLSLDDWFILITTLCGIPNTIIAVHGITPNGLGKDVWTLEADKVTAFGLFFYVMEILYFAEVTLLKMSILFFYLRIFPTQGTRRVLWTTVTINALFGVACILAGIFQCSPISHYWDKWDGEHKGACLNVNALGWANAIVSIVLDLWMLAIPLSQLPKLRLHWKRKVGVALMFCVGTFVTVVSILRLQSLVSFANSQNPTWDNWSVCNWSIVEINVGIMCACMPTARLALMRAFDVFRETTISRSGYYGYNNQPSGSTPGSQSHAAATSDGHAADAAGPSVIVYKKSYTVQYSDHDEASLVDMRNLDSDGRESRRAGGESY